jgi:hypothetical protein
MVCRGRNQCSDFRPRLNKTVKEAFLLLANLRWQSVQISMAAKDREHRSQSRQDSLNCL